MSNPGEEHWDYLVWILDYVYTNKDSERLFTRCNGGLRTYFGYCDADYAGDPDSRRSRTGYCFFLFGNLVAHQSKLQHCVTLSTCEAEFLAMVAACQFALWSSQLLRELGVKLPDCFELYSDNKSALMAAHTPVGRKQVYETHRCSIDVFEGIVLRSEGLRHLVRGVEAQPRLRDGSPSMRCARSTKARASTTRR
jgi:hypothetical protein